MLKNHALYSTVHTYRTSTAGGARPHAFVGLGSVKIIRQGLQERNFIRYHARKMDLQDSFLNFQVTLNFQGFTYLWNK
jgi:hypothetical protein